MIELTVPVEQIPYIRTIEGRKFKNGKWIFPDYALPTLQKYGLVPQDLKIEKQEEIEYQLSPHLYTYQKDIVNRALNKGCYAIFSDTGTGKCYAKGTKILMYNGTFKDVENITVGDNVMGDDSSKRTVIGLTRGNAKMYKVIPTKGIPFTVSENHTLTLKRTNTTNHPELNGNIVNISVKDYLQQTKTFKHLHKLYRTSVEFKEKYLYYEPYYIGLWLGDGTIRDTSINSGIDEIEIEEYLKYFCDKYNYQYSKSLDKRGSKAVTHHITQNRVHVNELKQFLTTKCIVYNEKRVPKEYLINSRENRLQVLAGLIDSDGSFTRGCFDFITKYKGLKDDIVFLAQSVGLCATTRKKKCRIKSINFEDEYYRVCISGDIGIIPTKIKKKQAEKRKQKKDPLVTGFKIERMPYDAQLYYGFETDGNHLHIIQDFFVQHNCNMGLEIARHLGKTLIVCPLSVVETAWIDDCHKFYPQKKIVSCWSDSKTGRIEALNEEADIYVMNYESYKILMNEIRTKGFDCMIIDESSCMKNMTSQITSMILEMVNVIPHRFVLSGCPCPNHNSEIFPQMKFVNNDIFGNNYYGFLARYFHQDMANPHVWYQTDEDKEKYNLRLGEQSVFLRKEDCVDLPEKVFQIRRFDLSAEQKKHYDELLNDIQSHINEWSKFEFTAKLMKLREVTSGFVYNKDSTVTTMDSNKPKILAEVLEQIGGGNQVIIWCQFQHEIFSLAQQFNGVALTSKTKDRDNIIRDFKAGKIQYLFTHPQLLGKGLTFVNCTYNVYYSLSYSYEEFKQSQDRIHRIGQTNKCTYIILQARNTIDEKIYGCLQRKENAVDELYKEIGLKGIKD